jgi:hypothetical protein
MLMPMIVRVLMASVLVALPSLASAQETRAGEITDEQAEKATNLAPYETHWAENMLLRVRRALVEQPSGLYPYFGSVYNGGGFTLGAGYRHFTGDRSHFNVDGLYSISAYKLIEGHFVSPGHASGKLDFRVGGSWRDATQVQYHGLGIDSPADIDTAFRMQWAIVGGDVTLHATNWLHLTGGVAYEPYTLKDPTGRFIPLDPTFTPETAPGLGEDPKYLHSTAVVALDTRPAADYARHGSLLRLAYHDYADRDDTFSFTRLDAEAVQHIPILRENWVLSLRGRLETTLDDADEVPYFMMPALGSGSTLRGYSSFRFRDRHGMLLSGEWRWIPSRLAIDMAFFYDTGMVAPRLDAITLGRFVNDYGIGIRFHSIGVTPLRVEYARGDEGGRIVFAGSAAF